MLFLQLLITLRWFELEFVLYWPVWSEGGLSMPALVNLIKPTKQF